MDEQMNPAVDPQDAPAAAEESTEEQATEETSTPEEKTEEEATPEATESVQE